MVVPSTKNESLFIPILRTRTIYCHPLIPMHRRMIYSAQGLLSKHPSPGLNSIKKLSFLAAAFGLSLRMNNIIHIWIFCLHSHVNMHELLTCKLSYLHLVYISPCGSTGQPWSFPLIKFWKVVILPVNIYLCIYQKYEPWVSLMQIFLTLCYIYIFTY